jgi:hypothetical protein
MPEDIRETSPDEYWAEFENKWTALMSYRYLGKVSSALDNAPEGTTMPLRYDMRNVRGGIMAAPLCIASPESGGMADDLFVPNPIIASMQILDDARDVKKVAVFSETIHLGRTMGFSRSRIVDVENPARVIALSTGMGISLGAAPPGFEKVDNPPIDVVDSPSLPPLHQVFGAKKRTDGTWVLPELLGEHASPDAALHLGPIHIVLETAANDLAAERAATDQLQIESWQVMFVARGKVGPFRASGESYDGGQGRVGVRVSLHDEGNGDRVTSVGSAVYGQPR